MVLRVVKYIYMHSEQCPRCRHLVASDDIICGFCGYQFPHFEENGKEGVMHRRWRIAVIVTASIVVFGIGISFFGIIRQDSPNYMLAIGSILIGFGSLGFIGSKLGIWGA